MRISFMRHGFLTGRFSDYSQLSFEDYESLLLQNISPQVDRKRTLAVLLRKRFGPVSKIYCSQQRRALVTARLFQSICSAPFESTHLLNEVRFSAGILSTEDIKDYTELRKRVLTSLYQSQHADISVEKQRTERLFSFLNTHHEDHILCVTHGWFLRLIQYYAKRRSFADFTLEQLLQLRPMQHLEIITVVM